MIAHLLFEQSGTFKRAFKYFGIDAYDYDIANDYGQTDHKQDLFAQIANAAAGQPSIFDDFKHEDIIMAFFPCIYFCENNQLFFTGQSNIFKNVDRLTMMRRIIERSAERQKYYELLLTLFYVCEVRKLRLIVENPYSVNGYLYNNFPYKPSLIDTNRSRHGDKFRKPTMYYFLNIRPKRHFETLQSVTPININSSRGHVDGGKCSKERSEITDDYAINFVADHIIGYPRKKHLVQLAIFEY